MLNNRLRLIFLVCTSVLVVVSSTILLSGPSSLKKNSSILCGVTSILSAGAWATFYSQAKKLRTIQDGVHAKRNQLPVNTETSPDQEKDSFNNAEKSVLKERHNDLALAEKREKYAQYLCIGSGISTVILYLFGGNDERFQAAGATPLLHLQPQPKQRATVAPVKMGLDMSPH